MENSKSPVASRRLLAVLKEKGNDVTSNDDAATNNSTNAAEVVLLSGKNTHRPNPTAGKLRARECARAVYLLVSRAARARGLGVRSASSSHNQ